MSLSPSPTSMFTLCYNKFLIADHEYQVTSPPAIPTLWGPSKTPITWPEITWPADAHILNNTLYAFSTSFWWPTYTDYLYGPTTGSQATAVSCEAKRIESDARRQLLERYGPVTAYPYLVEYPKTEGVCSVWPALEEYSDVHKGPLTTLCGRNPPRAIGDRETVTRVGPWPWTSGACVTSNYTLTSTAYVHLSESSSAAPCTIDDTQCRSIWDGYSSTSRVWNSANPRQIISLAPGIPQMPDCRPQTSIETDPCINCALSASAATLYYWPVDSPKDPCASSTATTPSVSSGKEGATNPITSRPNATIITNGHTMVYPTVYVDLGVVEALPLGLNGLDGDRWVTHCGRPQTGTILALQPSELSSIRNYWGRLYPVLRGPGTKYPFNYADLNFYTDGSGSRIPLIDFDTYTHGRQCPLPFFGCCDPSGNGLPRPSGCTIIRDDYAPWISMLPQAHKLDPNWASCQLDQFAAPVVSMVRLETAVSAAATATGNGMAMTTSASPRSPIPTSTPEPTPGARKLMV